MKMALSWPPTLKLQEHPPALDLDRPSLGRLGRRAAGHRAITQAELRLMEGALHVVAFNKAVAELGVAVGAQVVDGEDFTFHAEQGNVLSFGRDSDACAFKQIGLGGYVGPVAHKVALDQMG